MGTKSQNHYEVLGLWRDASEADVHRTYRRLAMLNHPDVSADPGTEERFRAIKDPYDVLSDPVARARFDATLGVISESDRRRSGSSEPVTVPGGWSPPWVKDWTAEAWLRASGKPAPWSLRALRAELRMEWKTLIRFLFVLGLIIGFCALLDEAIPGLGTVVVATVFMLPFFVYIFLVLRWTQGPKEAPFSSRRRHNHAHVD